VKTVVVNANFNDVSRYTDLSTGQAQIAGILSQGLPLMQAKPSQYGIFQFPSKAAVFVGIAMNTQRYPTNITAVRRLLGYLELEERRDAEDDRVDRVLPEHVHVI
jgi:hypothetical protein